jgi:hypothetical protein
MPSTDRIHELLRSEVSTLFDVHECNIDIAVETNLRTAEYSYAYTISKKATGPDKWRVVFAYPPSDVTMNHARDQFGTMLQVPPKQPLVSSPSNTEVWIEFGKPLKVGERYSFEYKCSTRIEGLLPGSPLGGYGCVWFWITHEYYCKLIRVSITLPKGLTVKGNDPIATNTVSENKRTFEQKELLPQQFCMALISYEKRFLRISPRVAQVLVKFFWIGLGAIVSKLLDVF